MNVEHLPTPALVVDEAILEKNERAMKELLCGSKLSLRPHYKSHKCAALARRQIEAGAVGMTCAKLSEAEDLAYAGIENILIANQIVAPDKIARLAHLAKACRLTVCVDNEENINALSRAAQFAGSTLYCLVEYEIGMKRCGVTTHQEVLRLAKKITESPNLSFEGIQAYAGHISHVVDFEERRTATERNNTNLRLLLKKLANAGLPAHTLSGGSTGSSTLKVKDSPYTELQAGSYLFMDATYRDLGLPFENSLFVLTTVVSQREGLTVVDAGVKSCGVDQGMPVCRDHRSGDVTASEEHFQIAELEGSLSLGDKLYLVPAHCCSTVNLYDCIYVIRDGKVVDRLSVSARGCSR